MRRLVSVLLLLGLSASGCGGDAPEPPGDDGIAALEQAESKDEETRARERKEKKATGRKSRRAGKAFTDYHEVETGGASRSEDRAAAKTGGGRPTGGSNNSAAAPGTAIPPGTYEYATDGRTTISGSTSEMPDTTTLTTHAPSSGEQRQVRDLRDEEGNGTVTETRLVYRRDGAFLTYVRVTAKFPGGLTDVREFRPANPQLIAPTGGAPGFARSFSMRGSGTRADVVIRALRYEKVSVGASVVRALVVDTKVEFSGSLQGEQNSLSWFWPKHVFVVREEVHTDVRNGPIRLRSDYDALVRRLP